MQDARFSSMLFVTILDRRCWKYRRDEGNSVALMAFENPDRDALPIPDSTLQSQRELSTFVGI